jgi:signal transduction histidine kinase
MARSGDDHGIGIAADEQRKIFERFTAPIAMRTARYPGPGSG